VNGPDPDPYRDALLDWLACAAGGAGEPAARAASAAGDGLLERVVALGTAGHVLDFDDTYLPGVAHLSAATAPATLVLGAERGVSVGEALDAYAAGFEAMGAMSRAGHPGLYDGGWHPTAVCGSLGSSVAAARLLGLGEGEQRAAMAISLLRAAGLRSAFGSAGKSLQVGLAAAEGVAAARLAGSGAEVDLDTVAGGYAGYESVFGAAHRPPPSERSSAIEENWIKAYPCCLQTHGAIEAAATVRDSGWREGGRLEVSVHPLSLQAAPVSDPADGLAAKFSIAYLTAYTLLNGPPVVESFDTVDDDARSLASDRVSVAVDPALAESEAVLAFGGEEVARIRAAAGSPQNPLGQAALSAKRRRLAGDRLEGTLDDGSRPVAEVLALVGAP